MPRTRLELVRFTPHAPQTCAATNYATSAWEKISGKFKKSYLLAFVAVFAGFVAVLPFGASTARFVAGGTFVLMALEFTLFKSVIGGCVVSVCSDVVCKTEMLPVKAGIASRSAVSIKVVAAAIVIFDKIVAVPRGPKAALDTLLVKSAPASVFPG